MKKRTFPIVGLLLALALVLAACAPAATPAAAPPEEAPPEAAPTEAMPEEPAAQPLRRRDGHYLHRPPVTSRPGLRAELRQLRGPHRD